MVEAEEMNTIIIRKCAGHVMSATCGAFILNISAVQGHGRKNFLQPGLFSLASIGMM